MNDCFVLLEYFNRNKQNSYAALMLFILVQF